MKSKLSFSQLVAKNIGRISGRNTWFGSNIKHPDNISVEMDHNVSIALGAVEFYHIKKIVNRTVRKSFTNTFLNEE